MVGGAAARTSCWPPPPGSTSTSSPSWTSSCTACSTIRCCSQPRPQEQRQGQQQRQGRRRPPGRWVLQPRRQQRGLRPRCPCPAAAAVAAWWPHTASRTRWLLWTGLRTRVGCCTRIRARRLPCCRCRGAAPTTCPHGAWCRGRPSCRWHGLLPQTRCTQVGGRLAWAAAADTLHTGGWAAGLGNLKHMDTAHCYRHSHHTAHCRHCEHTVLCTLPLLTHVLCTLHSGSWLGSCVCVGGEKWGVRRTVGGWSACGEEEGAGSGGGVGGVG